MTSKIISALAAALGLAALQSASAAGTYNVNTTSDTHAANPATSASDASSNVSLRSALEAANAQKGTTTINVPAGTYNLTQGELPVGTAINTTVVIQSTGTSTNTIINQTDGINRVFNIDASSLGAISATLSGLTIQGGHDASDNFGGAGILAGSVTSTPKDTLNLIGCQVLNNKCKVLNSTYTGQTGGGLQMAGGDLTVTNCVFANNSSVASQGGAIEFYADTVVSSLKIYNSTFYNNGLTNTSGSGPDGGGAIDIRTTAAAVHQIQGCTFSNNIVVSTGANNTYGGAIFMGTGTLDITKSIFIGNQALGTGSLGGAIYVDSGTNGMSYCRLTGNVATGGGSALYNHGSNGGTSLAANNWWGCNGGPGASGCDTAASNGGTMLVTPFIVLTNVPSTNPIVLFDTVTLTASFLQNSAGTTFTPAQIQALIGLPVTWNNPVLGTLSGAQTTIQANGTATATFTAGHVAGTGQASATVDSGTSTGSVTINCPTITATVSGGATLCAGSSGVIQVDVTGGYPPYTVTLSNSGGTQTGYSPLYFTNSPASTTVYQVFSGSDTNGCAINASGSATNVVLQLPNATITAAVGGVCSSSTGNTASAVAGAASYAWSISNGTITSATNLPTISYSAGVAGSVSLNLLVVSSNGCVAAAATNVFINPLPLNPIITVASGVCAGSAGNSASASSVLPGAIQTHVSPITYYWTIANGTITSATNLGTITYTAGTNGSVTLGVTAVNGSGCAASSSTAVPILAHPTAVVSGNAMITTGNATLLTATLTGTAPWTVQWSDGFVQTTNASPALYWVSPTNNLLAPSNYVYTVTALADANCSAGASDLTGSATVTVYSVPAAPVNISELTSVCYQTPNPLLMVMVANTNTTVDWYDAAAAGNLLATNTLTYQPTNTAVGVYTNYAQSRDLQTGTVNTNRTPVVFTINALPTATVSGDATLCNGDSTLISAALTGVGPWTVTWSDGVEQTTNASPIQRWVNPANQFTVPTNVVYTITNVVDANCSADPATGLIGSATITVNPVPVSAAITAATNICSASAGNTASAPNGATNYTWTIVNGTITSATNLQNISYTASASGVVTLGVTVWNQYGCQLSATTNVQIEPLPFVPNVVVSNSVCANSSGNLASAQPISRGVVAHQAIAYTYAWTITNGVITSATNLQTVTYTAGPSGTVSLAVTVFNNWGCSTYGSADVTINPLPGVPSIIVPSSSVCADTVGNTASGPAGATAYAWVITNGVITSATNLQTITYTAGDAGQVGLSLTVFNDSGCSMTGVTNIIINALPAVPTMNVPVIGVCASSTGNTASSPDSATAYMWAITNGVITSATNLQSISYTAGSTGAVGLTLTVFNASGCSMVNQTNVVINQPPSPPLVAVDEAVCAASAGNVAQVIYVTPGSVVHHDIPLLTYAWTVTNGVITSDTNLETITYTAGTNGIMTLTVTAWNASGCSATTTMNIQVNPLPAVPAIGIAPAGVCADSAGNTASGPAGATAYAWGITNGVITSATNLQAITYTAGDAGQVGLSLTVFNDSGCSESSTTNETINALPALPVIGLSATGVCAGSTGNTASGPAGATAYWWTITNGVILSATNSQTITYTAGTAGAVNLSLTVYNDSGCSVVSLTNVTVYPLPENPVITTPLAVCAQSAGNSATVISLPPATVKPRFAPTLTYAWTISNGTITSATNLSTITYTAGTNGTATLYVTVWNAVGCSASTSMDVQVNPLPAVPAIGIVPTGVCADSVGNTASGPAGATAYAWVITNGVITSATNLQSITYTAGDAGQVGLTLTVFNDSGCSMSSTTNETINALPALPVIGLSATGVCAGSTGNTASGPAGATAYWWTITNGVILSATNSQTITYTAGAAGAVNLSLTVYNASGCSVVSLTNVTVYPLPVTPVITTASAVCANSQGNVATVASPVPSSIKPNIASTLTYAWRISSGGYITSASNLQTITYRAFSSNSPIVLSVTVWNESGCSASTSTNIQIIPLPLSPTITAYPTSVCAGSSGNTASGPVGAAAYEWLISNGVITSATNLQNITYTAGTTGVVTLTLIVFNESGCSKANISSITINPLPATPTVQLMPTSLCGNSVGNLASGPAGATAYAWTISNGVITSATNTQTITYTAGASDAVTLGLTVFNASGCSTTVFTNVLINVDVTAPVITAPTNVLVFVPADNAGTNLTFTISALDDCDPNPIVYAVPASGSTFLPGLTTVTVTAADHSGNTNTYQFTVHVHPVPTVTLQAPTNNSVFVVPQNINLLADAADTDAAIRLVDFYQRTNWLGSATNGYLYTWSNPPAGSYQFYAVATDALGAVATSSVVNVSVFAHIPLAPGLSFIIETNTLRVRQTGLLYQTVALTNPTPLALSAVRLSISNLPAAVKVWNATGTNAGLPYLLYNQPVAPGGSVAFTIEYYVADGHTLPNPVFIADLIPATAGTNPTGTALAVTKVLNQTGGALLVEFATLTNRVYYVQYSADLTTWKTAQPAITGTGQSIQWIDSGPPKTDSLPSSVPQRYYRVILVP